MKKTPLHEQHISLGARMGEFGGWDMPIQYAGILQEHLHTRTKASIFDICHMGEFELSGPTALPDLERMLTMNIGTLAVGQCRYGYLLNDDGGVIDDLTCYRMAGQRYMLVVNAGTCAADADWVSGHLSAETRFVDLSSETAKLDLQGPESRQALDETFDVAVPQLGYFRAVEMKALGADVILSRTGYTGEWGYELYLPNDAVACFWEALLANDRVRPAGLGARDTLRLEMGYPLYGHELSLDRGPAAVSRGAFINAGKEFIGRRAVLDELANPRQLLVGLRLDSKRAARQHDAVHCGAAVVGQVTSGSLAPSLDVAVAMALVDAAYADPGRDMEVDIRGKWHPAKVVELPFYKCGTARGIRIS